MSDFHKSVLLKEVCDYLKVKKGSLYIDATTGGGGHGAEILKLGGRLLALDCDPEALKAAGEHFASACPNAFRQLALGNFVHLKDIAEKHGFSRIKGIIFDLGVSSHQIDSPDRGFSFSKNGPLDMRMDPSLGVTAADLVNCLSEKELSDLFFKLAQERHSRRIAEAICLARRAGQIKTTSKLEEIIRKSAPPMAGRGRINPATKVFQALRIAVNDELNNLKAVLPQAINLLEPGGRLVVISFHSGEDRIVKNYLRDTKIEGKIEILTKKPVQPTAAEIEGNPRSRSAKLRVAEKI